MPYAAGLALAVTLTGCAAESAAPVPAGTVPTPPPPSRLVTISEAPTSKLTTSASAAPDFPEGVPAAARKRTKAGAVAFVEHYIDRVNYAWRKPDPEAIRVLCEPQVKSCDNLIDTARELESSGLRWAQDAVTVERIAVIGEATTSTRVDVRIRQRAGAVVDGQGKIVARRDAKSFHNLFQLAWGQAGWLVQGLTGVES